MLDSAKAIARRVLTALHYVLPTFAYRAIYDAAFNTYRWLLRRQYAQKVAATRKTGDADAIERVEAVYAVMPHSLVGSSGLEATFTLAKSATAANPGAAIVECGVAQGGSAALLGVVAGRAEVTPHCWFFDSYEGLPEPTAEDYKAGRTGEHVRPLPKGSCLGTIEQVSGLLFDEFQLDREQITLVKGWFQDTLPVTADEIGPIAVLRLDGDWYDSTMCCLENLFDQVVDGGYVVIDDYHTCYGCQKAVDEFLASRGLACDLVEDGRGGCYFKKPAAAAALAHAA